MLLRLIFRFRSLAQMHTLCKYILIDKYTNKLCNLACHTELNGFFQVFLFKANCKSHTAKLYGTKL